MLANHAMRLSLAVCILSTADRRNGTQPDGPRRFGHSVDRPHSLSQHKFREFPDGLYKIRNVTAARFCARSWS